MTRKGWTECKPQVIEGSKVGGREDREWVIIFRGPKGHTISGPMSGDDLKILVASLVRRIGRDALAEMAKTIQFEE